MRLDKLFSSLGLLSRSECKKACKAGLIIVNGATAKAPDMHIDRDTAEIYFKGEQLDCSEFVYYMLNKPSGVVTAKEDALHQNVFSFVTDPRPDLAAVGRLDKDTTGLLLITNNGQLNHRLLSAKYHVPKTYIAEVDGVLNNEDIKKLENGIDIGDDTPTLPAKASILSDTVASLTIIEGRYHQVKRMFAAINKPVIKLHRESFGPLTLDKDLSLGEIRCLTKAETEALLRI